MTPSDFQQINFKLRQYVEEKAANLISRGVTRDQAEFMISDEMPQLPWNFVNKCVFAAFMKVMKVK